MKVQVKPGTITEEKLTIIEDTWRAHIEQECKPPTESSWEFVVAADKDYMAIPEECESHTMSLDYMHMYTYVHVNIYIYIYMYACISVYVYLNVFTYVYPLRS